MLKELFANEYVIPLIFGFTFGILTRLYLLRTDYRQYPTYPHGTMIHLALGAIASGLGAVAVPSLLKENYTAVTFLSLAAQQFRDVRNMERTSLQAVDETELVPRGKTYIEGIAQLFEGRNYLVILSSMVTTLATVLYNWWGGVIAGILTVLIARLFKSGKNLAHIVSVDHAEVRVDGPDLYVGDIYIMNVGSRDAQQVIREYGMGFILTPKNMNANVTISHPGQRQALLHDASTQLGVYTDEGEPSLTPLAKRDMKTGRIGVFLLPLIQDKEQAKAIICKVPILESTVRMPSEAPVNQRGGN
ncbi:YIEGIA family protein [Brevibacillus dissolubilis]|uniref:YIEGIA family protein n=1 Tax=Brevibacillus dissolubilis TaxID=1844116 RepID=UPI0011161E19|nr:YIEGIA family protein [Brevibacillus dissolubilis]